MAKVKINADELQRFLDAGHSQADAATHFGVSESAISQCVRKLQIGSCDIEASSTIQGGQSGAGYGGLVPSNP